MPAHVGRPSREEEAALIQACLCGEQAAWQRLYRCYRNEVWGVLFRILGTSADLEDLVQTVFFKVVRTLHRFEGRSKLSTWLYRICVYVAMDHLRGKRFPGVVNRTELLAAVPAPGPDPCEQLERQDVLSSLQKALSRMKESKRTVLILHDLMEVPAGEIASLFGKPVPTVRSRLFYARRELATRLMKNGVSP